jgi:hypothetical protein
MKFRELNPIYNLVKSDLEHVAIDPIDAKANKRQGLEIGIGSAIVAVAAVAMNMLSTKEPDVFVSVMEKVMGAGAGLIALSFGHVAWEYHRINLEYESTRYGEQLERLADNLVTPERFATHPRP